MAPSFVLLEREIYISRDEAVSGGGSISCSWEGRRSYPASQQEMTDVTTEVLRTFKPRVVVADPPELSFLDVLRPESIRLPPMLHNLTWCTISSADKNLVALYAGGYRPGYSLPGGYLIYDARKDSFSVIPELPSEYPSRHRALGPQSAVVMCEAAGDDYVLAELLWVWPGCSEAALWMWKSSADEWVLQPGGLHLTTTTTHHFSSDLCFSCPGSILCWVDLLKGMVVCHLDQDCKLRFIPLPQDCPTPTYDGNPTEFRSTACVLGEIKFVSLDDPVQHQPAKGLELTVWTLSTDLSEWKISSQYNVENIWANEAYQPIGIPKLAPTFPVLSIHEDGVIYLILNDLRKVDCGLEYIGQSFIRVDMDNNKVQFYPRTTKWSTQSQLFAAEFSAHRQRLQDHPVLLPPLSIYSFVLHTIVILFMFPVTKHCFHFHANVIMLRF